MTDTEIATELASSPADDELHRLLLRYESRIAENNSCDLFDTVAASMWLEDLSDVYLTLKKWQLEGVSDIREHLRNHPHLVLELASSIKVIDVNRATLDLFEVETREECLLDIQSHFGEGALEVFISSLESYWNKSDKFISKVNFVTYKGNCFTATVSLYPPKTLADSHRVYVVVDDITSTVQKQQQLEAVMSALPDLTMIFSSDGITLDILSQNSHLSDTNDSLLGKKLNEVINSPSGSNLFRALEKCIESQALQTIEYPLTINRRLHWFEANIAPMAGHYKGETAAVWIARDISDRKVMEIKLRQNQKTEALGSLSDGIAHEFNNLLAPIVGYSDLLLQSTNLNDFTYKAVQQIHKSSLRAADMIKQLLAYGGKTQPKDIIINLNSFLLEMRTLIEPMLTPNIELIIDSVRGNLSICADYTILKQVVINLCNNAIYAMPDGGKLTLRLGQEGTETDGEQPKISLTIIDNGCGIELDIMDRIFDPFFTTKPAGQSSGLGLSVVQGVMKHYQGEIIVESSECKGTSVQLLFPSQASINEQTNLRQPSLIYSALIVDSDEILLKLLQAMLVHLEFTVTIARSGTEALELLAKEKHGLVITDYELVDLSGLELISIIDKRYPNTKCILASGQINFIKQLESVNDEPLLILEKPFELENIEKLLNKAGFN